MTQERWSDMLLLNAVIDSGFYVEPNKGTSERGKDFIRSHAWYFEPLQVLMGKAVYE